MKTDEELLTEFRKYYCFAFINGLGKKIIVKYNQHNFSILTYEKEVYVTCHGTDKWNQKIVSFKDAWVHKDTLNNITTETAYEMFLKYIKDNKIEDVEKFLTTPIDDLHTVSKNVEFDMSSNWIDLSEHLKEIKA